MYDVFYIGTKPNLFPHERLVESIEQAQTLSRTRFCWVVTYLADYTGWDWLWEPAPWQAHQRHAWPDQHQPDSGLYLVPKAGYTDTTYHREPRIYRLANPEFWHIPDWIDPGSIDTRWCPDSADPPYIYEFPVEWKWLNCGGPQYRVPGASEIKYATDFVAKTQHDPRYWHAHYQFEWTDDVYRWRPSPLDPAYIYVFGNQWYPAEIMPTVEYQVPGATERKYMQLAVRLPVQEQNWQELYPCEFDRSWCPDPGDPAYIYVFGNQWHSSEIMPTIEYHVPGATERKFMSEPRAQLPEQRDNRWHTIVDCEWDYSWCPDPGDPAYIYVFGNQHWPAEIMPTVEYHVPGATERKFMSEPRARLRAVPERWVVPENIDADSFDFSWHPNPFELDYEYHFGTQWQPAGGPIYPGTAGIKLVDTQRARALSLKDRWIIPENIDADSFDFSWHPDPMEPPYEYHFGTQWQSAGGPVYPGTAGIKLVDSQRAVAVPTRDNWQVHDTIDETAWDWSWHPDPQDPPYVYVWGNQWWDSPDHVSISYTVPGATEVKYMEPRTRRLPDVSAFQCLLPVKEFDFSWMPKPRDPAMTYVWGNQWNPAELEPTIIYRNGSDTVKYMHDQQAVLAPDTSLWTVLDDIEQFDFSWRPNPTDPAYVYVFGNQWLAPEQKPSVQYTVPGATEVKYINKPRARRRSDPDRFQTHYPCEFDYTWEPDPGSPPYIYVFGNQWHSARIMPTVEYHVPGATDRKYMDQPRAQLSEQRNDRWHAVVECEFDRSWCPDPGDPAYIYVFGNQHWPAEIMPTVRYHVPGATQEKFLDRPRVRLPACRDNWHMLEEIDQSQWDWSWRPAPGEPPMIYCWGNQWNPAELVSSIEYRVPGATQVKYMPGSTRRLPQPELFDILIPVQEFDYSWQPNPTDPPMTYAFGSQWNSAVLEPAVLYKRGGQEIKYMDHPRAQLAHTRTNWHEICQIEDFDFSWRPDPTDPPYIYVFGNQHWSAEIMPTLEYRVPGATEKKFMLEPRARLPQRRDSFWKINEPCDWDFSWCPDPGDPPLIYVFGNQWWPAEVMPTVEYHVPGACQKKYINDLRATLVPNQNYWREITDLPFDFDRSWCPDPGDPPLIYVFGNQHWSAEIMPTIEYHVPGATQRKYLSEPRANMLPVLDRWGTVPQEIDSTAVDFSWCPDPGDPPYIYHFGSDYQISVGLTYTVPGANELKFAGAIPLLSPQSKAIVVPDIFYMDRSGTHSRKRFERLQQRYPNIQRIRWVNSTIDTIKRCCTRTQQNRFWAISSDNVYDNFDFAWHAQPWQTNMTHVFGSQWNKWSDTFLVNRWEFERHLRRSKNIEDSPNLNFVSDQSITVPQDQLPIYVIDYGNYSQLPDHVSISIQHVTRFYNSYLETLRRILADVKDEYVWVINTICDYGDFDFGWRPEPWQRDMLHVFPSGSQKFGDTFYVPVAALRASINDLERLEWFDTVNFCSDQRVERLPFPVIQHNQDSHVEEVKRNQFVGPAAIFTNCADEEPPQIFRDLINFWAADTRAIVSLDPGNQRIIVPREVPVHVRTQLYDYPYIDTRQRALKNQPLDVVFISNGEQQADNHFAHLCWAIDQGAKNRVTRVDGITGRVAAYHAAAQASTTPWFFAVFAKLEVFHGFDWQWQPDRMQAAKHYIFHARNPVNGLVYGHQAMIAYNRDMALANTGQGLDFTLDQPHEVVPILSGTAYYAVTPWQAWRTAFREAIKLRHSLPDVENEYRLSKWLETPGENSVNDDWSALHWSSWGAQDAIEYYDQVQGDFEQLRKSYEWAWLASYAFIRRGLTPGQQ